MSQQPLSPYLTDPFLRELIPQRITPAPGTGRGPTASWLAEHPNSDLETDADIVQLPIAGAAS